jgi:hypothetical protein
MSWGMRAAPTPHEHGPPSPEASPLPSQTEHFPLGQSRPCSSVAVVMPEPLQGAHNLSRRLGSFVGPDGSGIQYFGSRHSPLSCCQMLAPDPHRQMNGDPPRTARNDRPSFGAVSIGCHSRTGGCASLTISSNSDCSSVNPCSSCRWRHRSWLIGFGRSALGSWAGHVSVSRASSHA